MNDALKQALAGGDNSFSIRTMDGMIHGGIVAAFDDQWITLNDAQTANPTWIAVATVTSISLLNPQ